MSFQLIYAAKTLVPKHHWLRKIKIDNWDFIFIDGKPFIGSGLRLTSMASIITLPFIFNVLLPASLAYYFTLTFSVFAGDLCGSILKRRLGYGKGSFAPFIDHGDYIIFTGIVFIFLGHLSLTVFISALLITYVLHPLACIIGYKLHIKKEML